MMNDSLGDRMKRYEYVSQNYLTRRIPAIIRVDGRAFHTFTKGFIKPFDKILMNAMQETMKYMCENVQGCVFGYTQSDEITLVLTDYETTQTDAWFGYNVQKMSSVAASIATVGFARAFGHEVIGAIKEYGTTGCEDMGDFDSLLSKTSKYFDATFDARCFSIPREEVCNCLIWRQQDAIRNSIEAVGHANFSQSELHQKTCRDILKMLLVEKEIDWNDLPSEMRRGAACYRVYETAEMEDHNNPGEMITVHRRRWKIDKDIPYFTQEREYIERLL